MKTFKHSTLFILCTLAYIAVAHGQYHLEAEIQGFLPLSNNAKGYTTGAGGGLEISRIFNQRHTLSLTSQFLSIPGEKVDDRYLKYRHSRVETYTVGAGYAYSFVQNLKASFAVGPAFYTQPGRSTGASAGIDLSYQWHPFFLHAGIQRLFHKGHLDLFSFGLGYQIF